MSSAYLFRMNAGIPGDVNRAHPVSIDTALMDATSPPTWYGQPVIIAATGGGVRAFAASEQSNTVPVAAWGITVRPFPVQQATTNVAFGGVAIGSSGIGSIAEVGTIRSGYIIAQVPAGQTPVKGGGVYIWCAASTGVHILGGFEAVYSAGNTALLSNASFNSGADASGNCEIAFNV